jgi:RNA polymerase sigma-70 factor (ECF subfamily)
MQPFGHKWSTEPYRLQPTDRFPHPTSSNMSAAVLEQRPQILARAAQGDLESFSQLIDPLLDPAYRLAAVMLGDRSAAEDAVQEASIKAWRKLRQLRGDAPSLRAWFLSIVANECRMARRKRWFSVLKMADVPAQTPDERESTSDLHEALLRLTPDERLPLVLHFYLDLPLDEVARTLRVSPSAAKSRIYRAAKRLRADLTIEEVF